MHEAKSLESRASARRRVKFGMCRLCRSGEKELRRVIGFVTLLVAWNLSCAQDLVITNARILDGVGGVIESGTVVVSDGRIESVSDASREIQDEVIDAAGMTVMPGYIDTHVHVSSGWEGDTLDAVQRNADEVLPEKLRELLRAGFTTVFTMGDYLPLILDVRRRIQTGELLGPRMLVVGPNITAPDGHPAATVYEDDSLGRRHAAAEVGTPEAGRAKVRELAAAGVDAIKATYESRDGGPRLGDDVLAAIAEEAAQRGLPLLVHTGKGATQAEDAIRAVELGAQQLVHLNAWDDDVYRLLIDAGIPTSTTVGLARNRPDQDRRLTSVRKLWDAGLTVAYGTDGRIAPVEKLQNETQQLSRVLSEQEIVTTLTANGAEYLSLSAEIGTLEATKVADIVIIDGNPLDDIANLANVHVVILGGRIVVDNR